MTKPEATRKQAREAAREQARQKRLKEERRKKMTKFGVIGGIVAAAIATVTVTALIVTNQPAPLAEAFPDNMTTDGVIFTGSEAALTSEARPINTPRTVASEAVESFPDDRVNVTVYLDYSCPHCATFEAATADLFDEMLDEGLISLELKPIDVLGGPMSEPGANAAACLINEAPDSFLDFNQELFARISSDGNVTNDRLTGMVRDLGLTSEQESAVNSCIGDGRFNGWVEYASTAALQNIGDSQGMPLQGTPSVLVNGELFTEGADPAALESYIRTLATGEIPVAPPAGELPEEDTSEIGVG